MLSLVRNSKNKKINLHKNSTTATIWHTKPEEWLPCLSHKLKLRRKVWWIPNKPSKWKMVFDIWSQSFGWKRHLCLESDSDRHAFHCQHSATWWSSESMWDCNYRRRGLALSAEPSELVWSLVLLISTAGWHRNQVQGNVRMYICKLWT